MPRKIDTRQPAAVAAAVAKCYRNIFPAGDIGYVDRVFGWALDCFQGRYSDYLQIDARYHDLEHTLQGRGKTEDHEIGIDDRPHGKGGPQNARRGAEDEDGSSADALHEKRCRHRGDECAKHAMDHCQACAKACHACAAACLKMAATA